MPFGFFLAFAGLLVFPAFGRCDAEVRNAASVLEGTDFRGLAEVADQDHFIEAAHCVVLSFTWLNVWPSGRTCGLTRPAPMSEGSVSRRFSGALERKKTPSPRLFRGRRFLCVMGWKCL